MTKPKFDPNTIATREPAGGLDPTDFMRPMTDSRGEEPSRTKDGDRPRSAKQAERPEAAAVAAPGEDVLPMPPARQPQIRVNVNARLKLELNERLRQFVQDHSANMQDTIEMAIEEFLSRRAS